MEPRPKQREAIESWERGDACVVAGPGSGKTFVLVERFKWLVQVKGIPVHRILAITFTNKAADNMRKKLVEAFPAGSEARRSVERAYISTIDAFCARLLRENAIEAAVDPEFSVLDPWDADFELQRAIEETLEQEYRARPERPREFLASFGSNDVHGSLFTVYQALRAAGVPVSEAGIVHGTFSARQRWQELLDSYEQVASLSTDGWNLTQRQRLGEALDVRERLSELAGLPVGPEHFQALNEISIDLRNFKRGSEQTGVLRNIRDRFVPACQAVLLLEENQRNRQWLVEMLAETDRRYRAFKTSAGVLDYADLEEYAIALLEKAGGRLSESFSFVLMDEFQDTNQLQARLASLLRAGANFFAVGDINQSIYGFRHADPTVFRSFRDQTERNGGHVVSLVENFRSRPEVLAAVTAIIAGAGGVEPRELEAVRSFPPRPGPHVEILTVQAEDGEEAMKLEALYVAARIQELSRELALRYDAFAVLLRTAAQIRVFEQALRRRQVPCQVTAGRGFYEAREVHDLLHFLRLLLNPLDEISLAAVLRSPLAGVSDETLLRLKMSSPSLIRAVENVPPEVPPGEAQKLKRFYQLLDRYRWRRDYGPLDRLLGRLLTETGYEAWLLGQPGGANMAANVRKFLGFARRLHSAGVSSLRDFVDRMEDLRRAGVRESEAQPPEQIADAVRLMTIHAAKGLEFPVVFLPAINRRTGADYDAVCFSPNHGVGMRWREPGTGETAPDAVMDEIAEERRRNQRDETQRLFYVAMTRAEEFLGLSASFGQQVRVEQWACNLALNLGIDFKHFDDRPRELDLPGCSTRLLQTTAEPAPLQASSLEPVRAEPVIWFDRPSIGDQGDAAVSATSVALFAQCPRKYYLSRYLGFKRTGLGAPGQKIDEDDAVPPEPDEMDSTEFGRHVHDLLAGAIPRSQGNPEALALVANFECSLWGRRAAAAQRIQREQSFLLALDGRLLRGQIDLWFQEGDEIILLDYKTDEVTAEEAAGRAAEYELQLRLYALAVERLAGLRPQRAILYFLRPSTPIEVSLDEAALQAARRRVEELFEAQSRVAFPLREGEHCLRCPHFRGICPARYKAATPAQARSAAVE